ncbi:MAG: hypothetical protein KDA45_13955 [Planctomycetales bacterium]|nr:hypothetical protein [Planctomycetales bacterium]
MAARFRPGDKIVYTRDKCSTRPTPRAKNVVAARRGESYHYQVDKYWVVADVMNDGNLLVKTRRGKELLVAATDPRLRKASLLERLFKADQFPHGEPQPGPSSARDDQGARG